MLTLQASWPAFASRRMKLIAFHINDHAVWTLGSELAAQAFDERIGGRLSRP
jgi:hypothetical protein